MARGDSRNKELHIQEAISSGIEPISLRYNPIRTFDEERAFALHSELVINSTILGSLTPPQYEVVSDRTIRSEKLSHWAMVYGTKAISELRDNPEIDFITVRMPSRAARMSYMKTVERTLEKLNFNQTEKLCFDFPVPLLFEDPEKVKDALTELKKMGIKTLLKGFGDEFCPMMRLSTLPFDFVMLHPTLMEMLADPKSADSVLSVIDFVKDGGYQILTIGKNTEEVKSKCSHSGCKGYISSESYNSLESVIELLREEMSGD